jgi:hypothetical protein
MAVSELVNLAGPLDDGKYLPSFAIIAGRKAFAVLVAALTPLSAMATTIPSRSASDIGARHAQDV